MTRRLLLSLGAVLGVAAQYLITVWIISSLDVRTSSGEWFLAMPFVPIVWIALTLVGAVVHVWWEWVRGG